MTNAEAATNAQAASVAEQGAHVPPGKDTSTKAASRKKGAPKAKKGRKRLVTKARGKRATPAVYKATKASIPREFSKKAIVLDLLRRKDGATLAEIAKATDCWSGPVSSSRCAIAQLLAASAMPAPRRRVKLRTRLSHPTAVAGAPRPS